MVRRGLQTYKISVFIYGAYRMTDRDLSADMVTEVTAAQLRPLVLIKGEFDSGDLNLWSGIGTLSWNGDTYTGAGHLLSMSEVTENNLSDAQNTTFNLTGIDTAVLAAAL